MAVELNRHDLEFILAQIRIAEAHANGASLADLIVQPHLPFGLRTVDGSLNNILPGRELWGAADLTMPRMFQPNWNDDADFDSFDSNGPAPGGIVTNTDYDSGGAVADVDPRLISNLIVDQTPYNPAAVVAALRHYGFEGTGAEMSAATSAIVEPYTLVRAVDLAQTRLDALSLDSPLRPAALAELQAAQDAAANYSPAGAQASFDAALALHGIELESDGRTLRLPNVAPDEGLSAPFNGWMTFFGQFFDHGLDLISKGGNDFVYVPLQPDDPLYVPGGHTNFMVVKRATQVAGPGADGILGNADDTLREHINTTTPFVDQNQTYTSSASHQVFLREYEMVGGRPVATGHMLDGRMPDGRTGGLPSWAEVKLQAREMLGIELTDLDVGNVPLLRTDPYGRFIPDANGFAQVIVGLGGDGIPNTADDVVVSGTPTSPVRLHNADGTSAVARTSHAFLDDIAHNAAPVVVGGNLVADTDATVGNAVPIDATTGRKLAYDNELLDRHFITGDGRGNENIGLTAVHHVFHSEHNRQVEANKLEILGTKDLAFIGEWVLAALTDAQRAALTAASTGAELAAVAAGITWNGERLFQTARFATEMQYQHLVFEEFGRKIQPMIDPFVFNAVTDINPAIFAEFANVVYRFGHSMLTEDIARMFLDDAGRPVVYNAQGEQVLLDPATGNLADWGNDIGLIEAFLDPIEFDKDRTITHEQAAGAIFRGMNRITGSEIDEFVVDALRNNLLGLPLDLPAINIARGRDTGMPTLNQAREQLFAASSSSFVRPYASWADFAANLKTPSSVINFIAAYGIHATIPGPGHADHSNLEARRAAATALVLGVAGETAEQRAERMAFLHGPAAQTGVNNIDLWVGGLAEKKMPFGGMLGSTFNAVFEAQMEMLQDGDRFYYLTRTQGLNLLNELENNAFSKLIMANTDMTDPGPDGVRGTKDDIVNYHVGVDSFAKQDYVLHVDPRKQIGLDPPPDGDPALGGLGFAKVQRDNPATGGSDVNYLRFFGGEHIVVGGTEGADWIITDFGDDAIWGGGGDDTIESGAGVDFVIGGGGNDVITDSGDSGDFIKGEDGDDVIANSNGLDVLMGGDGKDVFLVGVDATEVFGGEGDDFILGGADVDFLLGNEGDDWIEAGAGFDTTAGDNSELFFNSTIIGHDVMFAGGDEHDFDAESGDDIMVQGESVMRNEGMLGFDWSIHKGSAVAGDSDLTKPIFTTDPADVLRDRFDGVEALSGWNKDDRLWGDNRLAPLPGETGGTAAAENTMIGHELDQAGIDRIAGLDRIVTPDMMVTREYWADGSGDVRSVFVAGNILLGGGGSDVIEGRGGDDVIDGDAWLNVRISLRDEGGTEFATVNGLADSVTLGGVSKPLSIWLLERAILPSQLHIVREIQHTDSGTDSAVFWDLRENYDITVNEDGSATVFHREQTLGATDPVNGRARVSDGTDTLRNIELLRFADGVVVDFVAPQLMLETADPLEPIHFATGFTEGAAAAPIANGTLIVDQSTQMVSARIVLTNASAGDELVVGTLPAAIAQQTDSSVAGRITVTLSGTASLADYQAAIQAISFRNTSDAPLGGNRLIEVTVNDGIFDSNVAVTTVAVTPVNDAPTLTVFAAAVEATHRDTQVEITFAELAAQGNENDVDGTVAAFRVTAVTSGTLRIGADAASATAWAAGSNDIVGGSANLNAYWTPAPNASGPLGAFTAVAVDDLGNASSPPVQATVNVAPVNDAPAMTSATLAATEGGTTLLSAANFGVTDPDNSSFTFTVSGETAGEFRVGGARVTSFTSAELGTGQVSFVHDGSEVAPGFSVQASDGALSSNVLAAAVTFTRVNDAPVLNSATLAVTEGGTTLLSAANFGVTDPDSTSFTFTVSGVTAGAFRVGGVTVTSFTSAQLLAGQVSFVHDGGELAPTFSVRASDGALSSNLLGAAVSFTQVNDAPVAGADSVVTNIAGPVLIREWMLLRNDTDAEGQVLNVAGATETRNNFTVSTSPDGDVTATRTNRGNHQFTYTATDGTATGTANVAINWDTNGVVGGTAAADILLGDGAASSFNGGGGNDIVDAGAGDDTVVWSVGGGRDLIDGGTGSDTATINGDGSAEHFRVYSRIAADTAGITGLKDTTEIVITRNGTTSASVVAELDNVEEIVINTGAGADTVTPIGDFGPTSLSFNTITINGGSGNDTVDITGLRSAHRIDFRSDGGTATLIGPVREQDVVNGAGGTRITPRPQDGAAGSDGGAAPPPGEVRIGTHKADHLKGTARADQLFGGKGNDRLLGLDGDDRLTGGAGRDRAIGGAGDDTFLAEAGDGDDIYHGDSLGGGAGADTLDMSAILANVAANLGSGGGAGRVTSAATGTDVLRGVENLVTGSGNDTITAGGAANVMDGGGGNDTVRFLSGKDADGDTILGFQPGDRIDLAGIDAHTGLAGNQSFVLVSGGFTGAGQIMVSEELRADGRYAVIEGTTTGGPDADFRISVRTDHELAHGQFAL